MSTSTFGRHEFTSDFYMRKFELTPVEHEFYRQIKRNKINPAEFISIPPEEIEKDRLDTQQRDRDNFKKSLENESRKTAECSEALVYELSLNHGLMGSNTMVKEASKYDNLFNSTDFIAEFPGEAHLALAIDFTFGDINEFAGKMNSIVRSIEQGTLTTVKYYKGIDGKEQSLHDVPKVIVQIEREGLNELISLILMLRKLESKRTEVFKSRLAEEQKLRLCKALDSDIKKTREAIQVHPFQMDMASQIQKQLIFLRGVAERLGNKKYINIFRERQNAISKVLQEKFFNDQLVAAYDRRPQKMKRIEEDQDKYLYGSSRQSN